MTSWLVRVPRVRECLDKQQADPSRRPQKKGPPQGERKESFELDYPTAHPEQPPFFGGMSKGARRRKSTISRAIVVVFCVWLPLCGGCHSAEPAADEHAAVAPSEVELATPPALETPVHHEALPRSVMGVSLEMSRADAEGTLGPLTCHENKAGFQVCSGAPQQPDDVRRLELYLHHEHVISVSYESPAPKNAGDALNGLIDRYGQPSLSGHRERDRSGQLHEIYGWKDDQSLCSVRFIWKDTEGGNSELVGTATALWDRNGYQQWEAESKPGNEPKATPEEPQEPI